MIIFNHLMASSFYCFYFFLCFFLENENKNIENWYRKAFKRCKTKISDFWVRDQVDGFLSWAFSRLYLVGLPWTLVRFFFCMFKGIELLWNSSAWAKDGRFIGSWSVEFENNQKLTDFRGPFEKHVTQNIKLNAIIKTDSIAVIDVQCPEPSEAKDILRTHENASKT